MTNPYTPEQWKAWYSHKSSSELWEDEQERAEEQKANSEEMEAIKAEQEPSMDWGQL